MYASARAETVFPLAVPRRTHASAFKLCTSAIVAARTAANSAAKSASVRSPNAPRRNVIVLLERSQRRLIAARDSQQAVRKNPLRIANVADHFLHRPFVRRIAKISFSLAARRQ